MQGRELLDAIVAATKRDNERLASRGPIAPSPHVPLDVVARLKSTHAGGSLALIAEIKKRSPSAGSLSRALSVADRAIAYARAGATMISVLVDRDHFDGGFDDLAAARAAVDLPVLCKGFVVDDVQLDAARGAGADAVLLIVRILDDTALRALTQGALARGLCPIVEVTDVTELGRALEVGARIVGVNARDLSTLAIDTDRAAALLESVPRDRVALHFSGLRSPADVAAIAARGGTRRDDATHGDQARSTQTRAVDGALVGEALMRLDDPEPLLRSMVAAATRSELGR